MTPAAICFDLDGTLVDSERVHWRAYRAVLITFGFDIDLEEYRHRFIAHGGGSDWACERWALPIDAAELRARKAVVYRDLIAAGVPPMPGARACIERLHGSRPLAVVTNSTRDEAEVLLASLGVTPLFDALVTRERYVAAKPAPDAYLAAASTLKRTPAGCIAVEDTPRGLQAARAAGLRTIAVPGELMADQDVPGATRRIETLESLTPDFLDALDLAPSAPIPGGR